MGLILSESFVSGIPASFASVSPGGSGGTLVATHNATEQSVDISQDAFNAGWRIDACPSALDMRVVLDLEVITLDRGFSTASGFGCSFKSATQLWAWNIACVSEVSLVAGSRGNSTDAVASAALFGNNADFTFPTGRHTYEFVCVRSQWGCRQFAVFLGGSLLWMGLTFELPLVDEVTPIFLIRDSAYRLHSIEVYDDPDPIEIGVSLLDTPLSQQMYPSAWPATSQATSAPVMLRRVDYGGPGRIVGTVAINGTPEVPVRRPVRLVRERDAVCVQQVLSDPITGAYEFTGFDLGERYTVLAYDHPGGYLAAVASGVEPELMPGLPADA